MLCYSGLSLGTGMHKTRGDGATQQTPKQERKHLFMHWGVQEYRVKAPQITIWPNTQCHESQKDEISTTPNPGQEDSTQ